MKAGMSITQFQAATKANGIEISKIIVKSIVFFRLYLSASLPIGSDKTVLTALPMLFNIPKPIVSAPRATA
jgi:hypothetical protein